MTLPDKEIEQITTKKDFVFFIQKLRQDLAQNNSSWENITLEDYLEALEASAEDIDGGYKNRNEEMPQNIHWKIFAELLSMASIYE